jgi:hypothetical protein
MNKKSKLLDLILKRLRFIKIYVGKHIVENFPMIKLQPSRKEELETVELILEEANQYGLRHEVDIFAKKFLREDPTLSEIEAYVMAYNEWIK